MNIMKPIASTTIPSGKDWLFEIKYDGFRCVLDWDINNIKLTSKNNKELTDQFPEIVEFCLEKQDLLKSFRSEEHTSELSHVAISYAVFCLKKKISTNN